MGIPVLRGRAVTEHDTESSGWVVVINEAMARKFWQNDDPIGRTITFDDSPEEKPRQIVGVVGNVHQFSLTVDPWPEAYIDYRQVPVRVHSGWTETRIHKSIILRTHSSSRALMPRGFRTYESAIGAEVRLRRSFWQGYFLTQSIPGRHPEAPRFLQPVEGSHATQHLPIWNFDAKFVIRVLALLA